MSGFGLHGTGLRSYGRRAFRSDRSYLTTRFFCIFYFPLMPIATLRVIPNARNSRLPFGRERYTLISKSSPDVGQVLSIYLAAALIVTHGVMFFLIALPWMRHRYGGGFGDLTEFILFAIWMTVPWLSIQWMRSKELERVLADDRDLDRPVPFC
jgi:hypothetical protein